MSSGAGNNVRFGIQGGELFAVGNVVNTSIDDGVGISQLHRRNRSNDLAIHRHSPRVGVEHDDAGDGLGTIVAVRLGRGDVHCISQPGSVGGSEGLMPRVDVHSAERG